MKKTLYLQKAILLIFVFLFLLTGCGQEKPPINNQPDNDLIPEDGIPENNGNSKPIDITPFDGLHITAQENAFWSDATISCKLIDDSTENIRETEQKLYEDDGILMLAGFDIDAGLSADEYMPGNFNVEYDLSKTEIDPKYYEYLRVYRVGDDGKYYELTANVEDGVLKFSSNQNSVFLACVLIEALLAIGTVAQSEYLERNVYFIKNGNETLKHDGKNNYGSWCIEWASDDIDPEFGKKLRRMSEIERRYVKEAEKKYREDDMYSATNQMVLNQMMCDYILNSIEKDEEHKKMSEQIEFPDAIREIDKLIGNAFRYLYQEEKMRMPFHRVPFKLIRDQKKYYGLAINRALSSAYIDINLNYVNPVNANDMYNLQMTLAHELLHVCQVRYRFPVDAVSDNTRYDEMVAQFIEEDALAYFIRKDIIPESANLDLTRTDYWGNLRLPINGEEDSNLDSGIRNDELINSGYNLGSFLRYLCKKEGKRPWAHTIMKARSYFATGISGPLCDVFGIDERAFDMYFRNWIISNRSEIAKEAMAYVMMNMYGLDKSTTVEKGGKYHKDFIHSAGYFLNIRTFEISKNEKDLKMLLVPDQNLLDVFPAANFGTGLEHKDITAGQYIDKFLKYSNASENCYLPVLEVQGYAGSNNVSVNTGYTIYVLDKTPSVSLYVTDEKLLIKLPEPEPVAADGVADGYIITLSTDNGLKKQKEITKDQFGSTAEISRNTLYNGNPDKDVTVTVTLNEFFLDFDKNRIMGIESDKTELLVEKQKKEETAPKKEDEAFPEGTQVIHDTENTDSSGYWKLKEIVVNEAQGGTSTTGWQTSYSASAYSHTYRDHLPANNYHAASTGTFVATCSQAPDLIRVGDKVIMHMNMTMDDAADMLITAYCELAVGELNDERNGLKYNVGDEFQATKEGAPNECEMDTCGNEYVPSAEVYYVFKQKGRLGSEIVINFYGCGSNTVFIYEWISE